MSRHAKIGDWSPSRRLTNGTGQGHLAKVSETSTARGTDVACLPMSGSKYRQRCTYHSRAGDWAHHQACHVATILHISPRNGYWLCSVVASRAWRRKFSIAGERPRVANDC